MAHEFFHPDMKLFIDHRVDWDRYFRLLRGPEVDVAGEIETYRSILAHRRRHLRGHRGGRPRPLARGGPPGGRARSSCRRTSRRATTSCARRAGLPDAEPGLRRLRAADPAQLGLPRDGVARRHQPDDDPRPAGGRRRRHPEVRQRGAQAALPAALRLAASCRAAWTSPSRRRAPTSAPSRPGSPRRTAATSSTAARSSSPTAAPQCIWCWRATARPSTSRRARPTACR